MESNDLAVIRQRLIQVVTTYDRKESRKKHYNRFALGLYFQAVDRTLQDSVKYGMRGAILKNFLGRLRDCVLVEFGDEKQSKLEKTY